MPKKRNWAREVHGLPLAENILRHWREFRPKMCRELKKRGTLYPTVMGAAINTADLFVNLRKQGMGSPEAHEIAVREWYRLPSEEDQPSLMFDPQTLQNVALTETID